jgi:hypothetical protein
MSYSPLGVPSRSPEPLALHHWVLSAWFLRTKNSPESPPRPSLGGSQQSARRRQREMPHAISRGFLRVSRSAPVNSRGASVSETHKVAPGPGCCGEGPCTVEPRARECTRALGRSRGRRVERGPRRDVRRVGRRRARRSAFGEGPENRSATPRGQQVRAASRQIPRNLLGGVLNDAGPLRQPPPGRPRWREARTKSGLARLARPADKGRPCAPSAKPGREGEVRGCHRQAAFAGGATATRA